MPSLPPPRMLPPGALCGPAGGAPGTTRRTWLAGTASLVAAPATQGRAAGDGEAPFPSRAVRLLVPFAPGQGSDVLARALAAPLGALWKHPVVVDNRPGANGALAVLELLRQPADGHQVLISSNSPIVINPNLYRRLPYRPDELQPLALLARTDVALVVPQSLGIARYAELGTRLKAQPGAFAYASPGVGSTAHLYMQMLARSLGVEITHVPYKGSSLALGDLLTARVQLMFDGLTSCMPHVRSGQLRVLAVAGQRASTFLPEAPTTASLGIEGLPGQGWYGAFARQATPPQPAEALQLALKKVAAAPAFPELLRAAFLEPQVPDAGALGDIVRNELAQWERLTRQLNIHRTE